MHAGLELFFIEGGGGSQWGAPSAFFAFPNAVEANKAAQAMLAQASLGEALSGGKAAASAAGSILEVCTINNVPLYSAAGSIHEVCTVDHVPFHPAHAKRHHLCSRMAKLLPLLQDLFLRYAQLAVYLSILLTTSVISFVPGCACKLSRIM